MLDPLLLPLLKPDHTATVLVADVQAHIAKAKASWRTHEQALSWEEKLAVIEKMRERSAQLLRARQQVPVPARARQSEIPD